MNNDVFYQKFLSEFENVFKLAVNTLTNEFQNSNFVEHYLDDFFSPFVALTRSGKRIRPFLICLGKGKIDKESLYCGVAIEILHTAALVHDDIIDKSELRRNVASAHKAYVKEGYSQDSAILLGDYLITYSNELLYKQCPQIVPDFMRMQKQLYLGQFFEMANWGKKVDYSVSENIAIEKSVNYTFKYPLQFGLSMEGKNVHLLDQYAYNIGLAFQMKDDWLDEVGTTEKSSNDEKNNVPNIVQQLLLQNKHDMIKTKQQVEIRLDDYLNKGLNVFKNISLNNYQIDSLKNLAVFCSSI